MTDTNNTVFKLQQAQDQLNFINQHLAAIRTALVDLGMESEKAAQRVSQLLPLLESASHDVAWKDATTVAQPKATPEPQGAIELLNAFKAALRAPQTANGAIKLSDLTDPIKSFSGAMKPSPQTPSQPAYPAASLRGLNLTDQARELLKSKGYFETIDALQKLHLGTPRDNIRRAVARAQGR